MRTIITTLHNKGWLYEISFKQTCFLYNGLLEDSKENYVFWLNKKNQAEKNFLKETFLPADLSKSPNKRWNYSLSGAR